MRQLRLFNVATFRSIIVNNKQKSLAQQFRDSFKVAYNKQTLYDSATEKYAVYRGEFNEYARPFDRYLEESRFKEEALKESLRSK
jgi:cytochrome c peroxidase